MFGHEARLWKAVILMAGGVSAAALSVFIEHVISWAVVFVGGLILVWFGIMEANIAQATICTNNKVNEWRAQVEVIQALTAADPEIRNAIGVFIPSINLKWAGTTTLCWQNTNVPMSVFMEFMQESNRENVVAQRTWKAKNANYHRWWMLIYQELTELDMVIPASHSGNRSELWRGNSFDRAYEIWVAPMISIPNLDTEREANETSREY